MKRTTKSPIQLGKSYLCELSDGANLEAEVSPCVFMYPDYPLQLTVTLKLPDGTSGGVVCPSKRGIVAQTANDADVDALLATVGTIACRRCSSPAFDPSTVETNRDGLCESCFTADLQAELDRELEIERLLLDEQDLRMKAGGKKYRVTAWIYSGEGDDEQVDWYFVNRPTKSRIRTLLQEKGSEILDDFAIITL